MSVTSKVRKRTALLGEVARRFPLRGLVRSRSAGADLVFWAHHRYPQSWLGYVGSGDGVVKDVALLDAVIATGRPFRVVTGADIGSVVNSTIVYSIDAFNPNRTLDYSASLMATLRQLEAQGNVLYPSADEAELWENKVVMHRRFDELGINSPRTVAVGPDTDLAAALAGAGLEFPLLAKEPHSNNSQGVHRVADLGELRALRGRLADAGSNDLLVQELLDMRRDLRVTMVGGEIVHHYWRINLSDEWMPTTTRKGSQVDFVTFPEQWRSTIVGAMAKHGAAALGLPLNDVMTRKVVTCEPHDSISNLMELMTDGKFRHLPVVQEERLAGIVSIGDVVKTRLAELEYEQTALRDYIQTA